MSYFDGLTDGAFKTDASGNTLFYPWGILGSGVIVESEEKKKKIRNFIKKISIFTLPAIIIIQITVGFWLNLILLPIFGIWYYFSIKHITKDLNITNKKLTISESYNNSAKSFGFLTLIFLEFGSIVFVVLGIWTLWIDKESLIAYASIGFFSLCAIAFGYMIVAKFRNKSEGL